MGKFNLIQTMAMLFRTGSPRLDVACTIHGLVIFLDCYKLKRTTGIEIIINQEKLHLIKILRFNHIQFTGNFRTTQKNKAAQF